MTGKNRSYPPQILKGYFSAKSAEGYPFSVELFQMYFESNTSWEIFTTIEPYYRVDIVFAKAVFHSNIHLIFYSVRIKSQILLYVRISATGQIAYRIIDTNHYLAEFMISTSLLSRHAEGSGRNVRFYQVNQYFCYARGKKISYIVFHFCCHCYHFLS